ncbi:MAG: hypothetical protein ACRELX_07885, partial [Longimicrobiales bacterium]
NGSLALEVELYPDVTADALAAAAAAFQAHPGSSPLLVRWTQLNGGNGEHGPTVANGSGARTDTDAPLRLRSRTLAVAPDDALLRRLRELFGADRIRLVRT